MDKNIKYGVWYQFAVLGMLALFNAAHMYMNGTLNDTITGAIIGVMVSLPFKDVKESKE